MNRTVFPDSYWFEEVTKTLTGLLYDTEIIMLCGLDCQQTLDNLITTDPTLIFRQVSRFDLCYVKFVFSTKNL